MDIAILNYPTGQVDVLRGVDEDFFVGYICRRYRVLFRKSRL